MVNLNLRKWVAVFAFLMCVISLMDVRAQSDRKFYQDFSISPPTGKGWRQVQDSSRAVVYMKKGKSSLHTKSLAVLIAQIEQKWQNQEGFLRFVKEAKRADTDPKRFKILEESYSIRTATMALCINYHTKAEDHGAAKSGNSEFLVLDITGMGCMHPTFPNRYYDIQYSERGKPDQMDQTFKEMGNEFVTAFEFIVP